MLGSVEASAFNADQLRMIAEFVDVRGGGLLLLGGARAFAEGGYAGTPLAEMMPVILGRGGGAFTHLKVNPTRAGQAHAVTQLGDTEQASADRWKSMPPLSTVNLIEEIKPGATTLLSGTDDRRRERVVLAYERYGRGKSVAFPVQDSWMWQMHATMRVEDQTHENFWRQLLRWLVDGVPDAVETRPLTDRVEPGQPVALTADVVDPAVRRAERRQRRGARHLAVGQDRGRADAVDGRAQRPVPRQLRRPATPAGTRPSVDATRAGKPVGSAVTHVRAVPDDAEYFDATMHAPLLKRIAQETGGRFYTSDKITSLPDDLKYLGARRDGGRRARAVAHADPADRARRHHLRRVGPAADVEAGMRRGGRRSRAEAGGGDRGSANSCSRRSSGWRSAVPRSRSRRICSSSSGSRGRRSMASCSRSGAPRSPTRRRGSSGSTRRT